METDTPITQILEFKGSQVHSVGPQSSVADAVRMMNELRVGSLVVIEAGVPVGIFTERDVLTRIVDAGVDPGAIKIESVMTRNILVIRPTVSIEDTMRIISQKRCRHLPVVDANEKLLGMISIGDVMRWLVREQETYIDHLLDYISGRYPS